MISIRLSAPCYLPAEQTWGPPVVPTASKKLWRDEKKGGQIVSGLKGKDRFRLSWGCDAIF